jgi:hypothetical protein
VREKELSLREEKTHENKPLKEARQATPFSAAKRINLVLPAVADVQVLTVYGEDSSTHKKEPDPVRNWSCFEGSSDKSGSLMSIGRRGRKEPDGLGVMD